MNREYYSYTTRLFKRWSRFYHILVDIPLSRLRDKVVDFVNVENVSRILDVATGTGGQAFAFAEMGYDVVGIDLSKNMLKVANMKNRHENLKFKVADATRIPFENNHFDVSCVSFALHDMPLNIREKTLEEMLRVTKPKGIIVIVDYALSKNKIFRYLIYHFIKSFETKYYIEYIKSNLETLFRKYGIEIENEHSVLFGTVRILKGIKDG